jgi:hypothetical protein
MPEMLAEAKSAELEWLESMASKNNYLSPLLTGDGRWVALSRFIFTTAIITGQVYDDWGFDDRWCYDSTIEAGVNLAVWAAKDFKGEPHGWHRHPDSGRRRPDGDESKEYINK